jgi:hypothetical protein
MTENQKRSPGTPPGVAKNPTGINQFTGTEGRGKSFSFRFPITLDTKFRSEIETRGVSITEAFAQAIELWLDRQP